MAKLVAALHAIGQVVFHVVAQIIEAEFVVGAVGDVRAVGRAALHVVEVVDNHAHRHAQQRDKSAPSTPRRGAPDNRLL